MDLTTRSNIARITRHNYCTPEMLSRELTILKILVRDGIDINTTDCRGRTALMIARNKKIFEFLVASGANIDARDTEGKTPLMHAKSLDIVQILIQGGANIDARDNFGNTAIMYANSRAAVEYFVTCGANLSIKNTEGKTGYDHAAKYIQNFFPIYSHPPQSLYGCDACAICLENLTEGVCELNRCNHFFHTKCIDAWLQIRLTCPSCRQNLKN